MIPVDQTKLGFGSGNCGAACIASILEISIEDIPNFHGDDPKDADTYWSNICKWCENKPFMLVSFYIPNEYDAKEILKDCWCIASGLSPRRTEEWHRHAVVWRNGEIVHDPHPSRLGLREIDMYDVFIWKNPAKTLDKY